MLINVMEMNSIKMVKPIFGVLYQNIEHKVTGVVWYQGPHSV